MEKYILLVCMSFSLVACASPKNEAYYRQNPQQLQQAVQNCSNQQSTHVSCERLAKIAQDVNELAYQLQINPQSFGKTILQLQQTLAQQQAELKANPNQAELKTEIEKNKQQLAQRLAIVKWLESPES